MPGEAGWARPERATAGRSAEEQRGGRRRVSGRSDGVSWAERPVSGWSGGGGEGGEEERRRVVGGAAGRKAEEKSRQWPERRGALTGGR
uniref:Uncharacterized protein n=1 Tax=Oryza nivara TaxID=4536 RepID=A0A0E0HJ14_ORYNI